MAGKSLPKKKILLSLMIVTLFFGLIVTAFVGVREKQRIMILRDESLNEILKNMEIQLSSLYQIIATASELAGDIPQSRGAHEFFLKKLLSSSRSKLLYGIGLWYEPGLFEKGTTWYGPYARRDENAENGVTLTYEWSTPEYDYHSQDWYKFLSRYPKGEIGITPPYFDTDYTYITLGSSIYGQGVFQGVITLDIIVPRLIDFLDQFDYKGFKAVYLSDSSGQLIYSFGEDRHKGPHPRSNIRGYLDREENNSFVFSAQSEDMPFTLYGTMGVNDLRREMHRTRLSLLISLIFWLPLFIWYSALAAHGRQSTANRLLSQENVALKNEIETRKRSEAQLQYLAFHDSVTGLENLRSLKENIPPPRGAEDKRQLMQISLDNIRELSYVLDEDFIDSALSAFAEKLKESGPGGIKLFRGSGFIFFLLFENMDEEEAEKAALGYLGQFRRTIRHKGKEVRPRIRISIIPFREAEDMDQLISQAGMTLTEGVADSSYRYSRVIKYDKGLNSKRSERMELDTAMGNSDFLDELLVYYQPIVRLSDRETVGYEALVRWMSEKRGGLIPPDHFIPLAEENGHIIDIGWHVIKEALRILSTLGEGKSWFISVNVSPVQFIDSDFLERLESLVREAGVRKKRLKLEITETYAGKGALFFWESLLKIEKAGYLLVMDDFGTGESSLGRLQTIPFDTLKLDRLFVNHLPENKRQIGIMESLVKLNGALGTTLIAEGVEKEEEHELLLSLNVPYAQGYLYSRPLPEEKLMERETGKISEKTSTGE